jgi:tetratricopeptide (TPR) repeat protein
MISKHTLPALFLLLSHLAWAQQPVLKVPGSDSASVQLRTLHITTAVTGNIATTTMEMEFCNSGSRVLEGELTFPMPDGVSISRYALDINGVLREAVPVEKEKGQVVFETIERRRVDPGLLEKVEGNNFRTRIYPIPAQGCRKIVIAYEQELRLSQKNALVYSLPLQFKYPVANFSMQFNIYSASQPEIGADCNTGLRFSELKNVFSARTEQKNFTPTGGFTIEIPKMADAAEVQMQQVNGQYYFLVNTFPEVKAQEKPMPQSITLLWDASLSGQYRDHEKEFAFLDGYFKKAGSMKVTLSTVDFGYRRLSDFTVSGGNWSALRQALEKTIYDGATNFSTINQWPAAQECLFFTDGLNTWGRATGMNNCPCPIYTVNAAASADYSLLKLIAAQTGGAFIDLNAQPAEMALRQISQQPLQLLGMQVGGQVSEVYPSVITPINGGCTLAGISSVPATTLTLQYGYGKTVTATKTITLDFAQQAVAQGSLPRIWAQKKIAQLDMQYEVFKGLITDLGKKYGIVTRNTSLIVLDNVEDYVRYEIEPPAELKAEYDKLVMEKVKEQQIAETKTIDQALGFYKSLTNWWQQDFKPEPIKKIKKEQQGTLRLTRNGDANFITGLVRDAEGNPIAGATVSAGRYGVATDANGRFRMNKPANERRIRVSYVGYITLEGSLANGNVLNATLRPVSNELEEVVVTGASNERRVAREVTGSVASVQADSVRMNVTERQNASSGGFDRGLAGNTPGVQLTSGGAAPGEMQMRTADSKTDSDGIDDKAGTKNEGKKIKLLNFTPDRVYLKQLDSAKGGNLYEKYIELRKAYLQIPSFYFDVAQYFFGKKDTATGLKILSNITDLNIEDHELYKMLGYQLKTLGRYTDALFMFGKVLEWRPQEPHSYRDYGLALADAGLYQNAMDTLYLSLVKNFNTNIAGLYPGIEEITVTEINNIAAAQKGKLNLSKIDSRLIQHLPVDVRVVLNWNMNDTDIDLWTFDPNGEKCFYSHKLTAIGGRNSNDFTRGYGPEQFMLKKALKGKYEVKLHYYGSSSQKLAGGATIMAEIFTHYGQPNQQRQVITLQMEKDKQQAGILVGSFEF